MPTLRALLTSTPREPVLDILHRTYVREGVPREELDPVYQHVWDELEGLAPSSVALTPDALVAIRVSSATGEGEREVVGLARDGVECALDFVDWQDLIDLPVEAPEGCTPAHILAAVLWELTFYGYSVAEVAAAREQLLARLRQEGLA